MEEETGEVKVPKEMPPGYCGTDYFLTWEHCGAWGQSRFGQQPCLNPLGDAGGDSARGRAAQRKREREEAMGGGSDAPGPSSEKSSQKSSAEKSASSSSGTTRSARGGPSPFTEEDVAAEEQGLQLQMQQANASMSEFQANIAYEVEKGRLKDLMDLEQEGTPEYAARKMDLRKHLATRPIPKEPQPSSGAQAAPRMVHKSRARQTAGSLHQHQMTNSM